MSIQSSSTAPRLEEFSDQLKSETITLTFRISERDCAAPLALRDTADAAVVPIREPEISGCGFDRPEWRVQRDAAPPFLTAPRSG
jgi:hypothetical protein